MNLELSIIILAYNEADNLKLLIPKIKSTVAELSIDYEILIVDGNSSDQTVETGKALGCRVSIQRESGYGNAFKQAFNEARGKYVITIDADCSHDPRFINDLWQERESNELVIASRYIKGGEADMPIGRKVLSMILNRVYSLALSLPYRDLSSGFRLYNTARVKDLLNNIIAQDFNVLLEVLIRFHCDGYSITEIPFSYQPRNHGRSSAKIIKFGISYIKTIYQSWQLRNSAFSSDYDNRAFNSVIPLQRYWQRKRYAIITGMLKGAGRHADLGCGSSRIIQSLPNSVGLDIDLKKLRYVKKINAGQLLVKGSISDLPFKSGMFSEIICSQVIEHIPKTSLKLEEFNRILESNGYLILGTPDYSSFWWRFIEWFYIKLLPFAYGEGHIARYDKKELEGLLIKNGFEVLDYKYILKGELIINARKA